MKIEAARPKVGIVIQARMNSSRLPGKVLKIMAGKPVLLWLLERLTRVKNADTIIVATSQRLENQAIVDFCREQGVLSYQGNEEDVLSRYIEVAALYNFDHVVRCTGDNPFHDPIEIDFLIQQHLNSAADYSSNVESLPKGIGAEIFSASTIARLASLSTTPAELEHVNEYLIKNPEEFTITKVRPVQHAYRGYKISFSIDTPEDFSRVEKICRMHLNSPATDFLTIITASCSP